MTTSSRLIPTFKLLNHFPRTQLLSLMSAFELTPISWTQLLGVIL